MRCLAAAFSVCLLEPHPWPSERCCRVVADWEFLVLLNVIAGFGHFEDRLLQRFLILAPSEIPFRPSNFPDFLHNSAAFGFGCVSLVFV